MLCVQGLDGGCCLYRWAEGIEESRIPFEGTYNSDGTVQDELGESYFQPGGKVEMRWF